MYKLCMYHGDKIIAEGKNASIVNVERNNKKNNQVQAQGWYSLRECVLSVKNTY